MTEQGTGIALGGPFDGTEFPLEPAAIYAFVDDSEASVSERTYASTGERDDKGRLIYRPVT